MSNVDEIYNALVSHIKDTAELRELADRLSAEAERRDETNSGSVTNILTEWPFSTSPDKTKDSVDIKNPDAQSPWPFPIHKK